MVFPFVLLEVTVLLHGISSDINRRNGVITWYFQWYYSL